MTNHNANAEVSGAPTIDQRVACRPSRGRKVKLRPSPVRGRGRSPSVGKVKMISEVKGRSEANLAGDAYRSCS